MKIRHILGLKLKVPVKNLYYWIFSDFFTSFGVNSNSDQHWHFKITPTHFLFMKSQDIIPWKFLYGYADFQIPQPTFFVHFQTFPNFYGRTIFTFLNFLSNFYFSCVSFCLQFDVWYGCMDQCCLGLGPFTKRYVVVGKRYVKISNYNYVCLCTK